MLRVQGPQTLRIHRYQNLRKCGPQREALDRLTPTIAELTQAIEHKVELFPAISMLGSQGLRRDSN
ncbi:MAG: hypothetical protein WCC22_04270 [Terriglobales bacterium]